MRKHFFSKNAVIALLIVMTAGLFFENHIFAEGIDPISITPIKGWESAEQKILAFANEHLNRMYEHDQTLPKARYPSYQFDMEWVELESRFIDKYLPKHRVFVDRRFKFTLTKDGTVACLNGFMPLKRPFETTPDLIVTNYNDFIKGENIVVDNEKTAIDMVLLRDIVYVGNGFNTDDRINHRLENWRYEGGKEGNVWNITMDYIGPPASIFAPPTYHVVLDEQNRLLEVKENYNSMIDDLEWLDELQKKT